MTKINLLVLFVFRTGSSYIMQALRSCKDTYVFGDYGEVLTLSEIKKTGFAKSLMLDDKKLPKYAFEKLEGYLRYLSYYAKGEIVCSKISLFQIQEYIDGKNKMFQDIVSRKNTKILVLTRNPLDIYISWQKARETKRWGWLDTTGMKVSIDINHFCQWNCKLQTTYRKLFNYLKSINKPYTTIDYDELNGVYNDMAKIRLVTRKLATTGLKLELDVDKYRNTKFLFKQDRSTKHEQKIKNYEEVEEKLKKRKLGYILKV